MGTYMHLDMWNAYINIFLHTRHAHEKWTRLGVVVHAFNPSTQEAEAGGVWGQPGLQSEFQDSQGYTERSCLKQTNKQTNENNNNNNKECVFFP
jgi:hypothetical protein